VASSAVERFTTRAQALGVEVAVREFPQGTRTAADAADAIGCDVAQIVKSLVFDAGGRPVLALTSGANRVDEGKLAAQLGVDHVGKADAAQVREATGYAIGGTPPFGHDTRITVLCDTDLTGFDEIWAAAGTPSSVFPLTPATLLAVTGAPVVDLAVRG
jgi:prolyl-tRNA editing enzyme YbaK/EbsC (Cys-tRNA(Pro) deacylase)